MTINPVNLAIEVIRLEVERLKAQATLRPLDDGEAQRLLAYADQLRQIEHGRGANLVAAIAGRRALDKLPAHEIEQVVKAIAGIESKEPTK